MSKTLRAGVIGCGSMGEEHSRALAEAGGMKMAAFCDARAEAAEALCGKFAGEYSCTDPQKLFEDASLDAIYVCTYHDSHAELCVRAADAGKHIMVEKPLAMTVDQCRQVGRAVEKNGVRLMIGFMMRYYELIRKAREIIPAPLIVIMQMMDRRWPDDFILNDPAKGGGNIIAQGCHSCDLLRFLAGAEPIEVYASGGNYYTANGLADNICATFRFENGVANSWVQGNANHQEPLSKFFLQVFAADVSVSLTHRFCKLVVSRAGQPAEEILADESAGFVEENRDFVRALQEDTPPAIDHRDGLMATLMVLQAMASAKSGQPEPIKSVFEDQ